MAVPVCVLVSEVVCVVVVEGDELAVTERLTVPLPLLDALLLAEILVDPLTLDDNELLVDKDADLDAERVVL